MILDHADVADINAELDRRAAISAEPLDFVRDHEGLDDVKRRFDALVKRREGIELALAMVGRQKHPWAAPDVYSKAEAHHRLARNPERSRAALEAIDEEIEELRPQLDVAQERARLAREQRAIELARSYRPRHKKAVRAIAAALETLSKAVAAEQQLQQEFAAESGGAVLPNFGGPWRSALLNLPTTLGSEWIRWAQRVGFVDE